MAKAIMVQGTASSVGKSIVTAGLCRVLKRRGYQVAPFKSQNMALNSFITDQGHEMGRAQVVQAEAASIKPDVRMNPILLKPSTDQKAQVIIEGKVYDNMSAKAYHDFKPTLKTLILKSYEALRQDYPYTVLEGAGSPAEINLREGDVVNMGMAEIADCPVILVGDIDRGGVFASLYGTVMLLTQEERKRVKGVVINKFRGDVDILKPGLKMLEDLIQLPVLGVLPYADLKIEDEDSLAERFRKKGVHDAEVQVEVLYLPHVSNFTDFNVFETQTDVNLRYVMRGESIGDPDVLILPGSKNTIEDLMYLHQTGLAEQILRLAKRGKTIVGICGGYQMLGLSIDDPHGTESSVPSINGLGLLPVKTHFEQTKTTTQVTGIIGDHHNAQRDLSNLTVRGYEIHMGQTTLESGVKPFLTIDTCMGEPDKRPDGAINSEGNVFGSYVHGLFDDGKFVRAFINGIRSKKGLGAISGVDEDFAAFKEKEYEKLADLLEKHLDIEQIITIMETWPTC